MSRSIARRLGACVALLCASLFGSAAAHYDDAYYYDYRDLPRQNRWMSTLHDDMPLRRISMPGTHGSAARHGGWVAENQTLTLTQQLNAGIRFLDLRTRHVNDTLELYHGPIYQYQNFAHAVAEIVRFMQANPTETVFVRVKEEYAAAGNSRNFEETVDSYHAQYGKYFHTTPSHWDLKLGQVRGKIIMIREFVGASKFGYFDFHADMVVQDNHHLTSNWDLYRKWSEVKIQLELANWSGSKSTPFINFLSGSGGALPYFVASGHSDRRTDAPGLSTGMVTPFFDSWYPDFPRGACFIGMCTIFFEGTNTLTKNELRDRQYKYVGIIAADFPGPGLIQSVINVNRTQRTLVNAANGECLTIAGGLAEGHPLVTETCHGGPNQQFTVRGDQIFLGNKYLCLDAHPWGTMVFAALCSGQPSQRWQVYHDGIYNIAGRRCLDVIVEERNRVGLWGCWGLQSSDQQFAVR